MCYSQGYLEERTVSTQPPDLQCVCGGLCCTSTCTQATQPAVNHTTKTNSHTAHMLMRNVAGASISHHQKQSLTVKEMVTIDAVDLELKYLCTPDGTI